MSARTVLLFPVGLVVGAAFGVGVSTLIWQPLLDKAHTNTKSAQSATDECIVGWRKANIQIREMVTSLNKSSDALEQSTKDLTWALGQLRQSRP